MKSKRKIICIVGPTASGKTEISLKLAKKFQGFIISADSRQIYKGMDIGTSKPEGVIIEQSHAELDLGSRTNTNKKIMKQVQNDKIINQIYQIQGISHYLIDIIYPDEQYTLANWQKQAKKIIEKTDSTPFVVGGTGLYISSLVNNYSLPSGKINKYLRNKLESQNLGELLKQLKEKDPTSYENIDKKNQRRVIRALEYVLTNNESFYKKIKQLSSPFEFLQIGIKHSRDNLYKLINQRVEIMLKNGLIQETEELVKKYSPSLPALSGIGYQETYYYLNGRLTLTELKNLIQKNTRHYAKRQLTWFKRDKNINWVENFQQAEKLVASFLS